MATTTTTTGWGSEAATNAATWDRWASALPRVLVGADRALVVAPHPDDETFGCGGLIAYLVARGTHVTVATVSDGAASHPGVADLAERRRAEQRAAVRHLGVDREPVWLGRPDGGLADRADELAELLAPLVEAADLIVAPWAGDGHPDHEVVGAVAAGIAATVGCRCLAYPVWWWRWGQPEDLPTTATRLDLDAAALAAKRAAIGCFPTQTTTAVGEVIVDAAMVDRFSRPFEVLFDA